jgi:hypothetical protein
VIDTGSASMTHNTLYTFNPFGNIPIGTGDGSRISDTIHIKSVKLRGEVNNYNFVAKDADVFVRLMWVKMDSEYLSGSDTLSAGVGSTDIFVNGTTSMLHGILDNDKCTVLADKTIKLTPQSTSVSSVQMLEFDMPITSSGIKMQFKTLTSNYGKAWNYYFVAVPYSYPKTGGITVLSGLIFDSIVNFVDTQ